MNLMKTILQNNEFRFSKCRKRREDTLLAQKLIVGLVKVIKSYFHNFLLKYEFLNKFCENYEIN